MRPPTFMPPLAKKLASAHSRAAAAAPTFIPPLSRTLSPRPRDLAAAEPTPDVLNLAKAARYLGVSEPTMAKIAQHIPHLHLGRIWRFDREVLDKALRGGAVHRAAA